MCGRGREQRLSPATSLSEHQELKEPLLAGKSTTCSGQNGPSPLGHASPTNGNTVEALLTDNFVSGQLYLRPPCLKPRFNSHTNSVFLHSRKGPRTLSGITT